MIKSLMIVCLVGITMSISGQKSDIIPMWNKTKCPYFTKPIDFDLGHTKITLYNYNKSKNVYKLSEYDEWRSPIDINTFYIRKELIFKTDKSSETYEYFRLGKNKWREISTKSTGMHVRNFIVTNTITERDTSILINPDTYDDYYYIVEYQMEKVLRTTPE